MLAIWILLPQNEGEKVIYLLLSSYFVNFEEKVTAFRGKYLVLVHSAVLQIAVFTTDYCSRRVDASQLGELRQKSELIDQTLLRQIKVRGAKVQKRSPENDESSPDGRKEESYLTVSKRSYTQEMALNRKSRTMKTEARMAVDSDDDN